MRKRGFTESFFLLFRLKLLQEWHPYSITVDKVSIEKSSLRKKNIRFKVPDMAFEGRKKRSTKQIFLASRKLFNFLPYFVVFYSENGLERALHEALPNTRWRQKSLKTLSASSETLYHSALYSHQ